MRALTTTDREAVIAAELAKVNYHEGPNNQTPYGDWIGAHDEAWCAAFQSFNHFSVLGFSPFPATSAKGSASCFAIQQYAIHHGMWVDASEIGERGDLPILQYAGDSIVHHIRLLTEALAVRRYRYVAGNEGNAVRTGIGTTSLAGYVRLPYSHDPTVAIPEPGQLIVGKVDLGNPPSVRTTQHVNAGPNNDPVVIEYVQKFLNAVLPMWGMRFHTPVDGIYGTATELGVVAFKRGANDKQWQSAHGHVTDRLFHDPNSDAIGPKTLQYGRFFAMLGVGA